MTTTTAAPAHQAELDSLAEFAGCEMRFDFDVYAPMTWAVWATYEDGETEIIGAGEAPSEALEEARVTVRGWNDVSAWGARAS